MTKELHDRLKSRGELELYKKLNSKVSTTLFQINKLENLYLEAKSYKDPSSYKYLHAINVETQILNGLKSQLHSLSK